jgi:penicillin-binding protein 1C
VSEAVREAVGAVSETIVAGRLPSSPQRSTRASRVRFWLGRTLIVSFLLCLAARLAFAALHDRLIDDARFAIPADSLAVLDREGHLLRHERPLLADETGAAERARVERVDRRWVSLDHIDADVLDAVIAVEDQRFREHDGVDLAATVRAIGQDLVPGGRRSGASTITQQLVKLVYGRPHGPLSKGLEILRAIELEDRLSKDEILAQYLNRLPYGNGIVGIERAAEAYFGRHADELTLGEAALLAGLPQAPSRLDPRRHLARAIARRDHVLDRMLDLGVRSPEEIRAARAERPSIRSESPRSYRAPRFVDHVVEAARRGEIVAEAGALETSLDLPLQDEAEEILAGTVTRLSPRGATNAAGIVVLNATGEIRAYVGAARSGADAEGGQLDLLRARRQPGSTLKPFLYAFYFARGAGPASIVDDLRAPMTGHEGALYAAENYDGSERGPVSARAALAGSLNLAALDVARRLGQDRVVSGLAAFGLARGLEADDVGAAVVLGGADTSPLALAEAYVALARGGTRIPLRSRPLEGEPLAPRRVIARDAALLVRDVLSDREARRAGFGDDLAALARSALPGQSDVALKTGTSASWRDAWAASFDDDFTVIVWVGDPSGDPMERVSGFEAAAPAAMQILGAARARRDDLVPADAPAVRSPEDAAASSLAPRSSELAHAHVCHQTGLLPGARCTHVVSEVFPRGHVPTRTCDGHDADGALLLSERYRAWLAETRPLAMRLRSEGHAAAADLPIRVTHPEDGAILVAPPGSRARIPLRAALGSAPRPEARFEIDGRRVEGEAWELAAGPHRIVAIVDGRRSEESSFEVRTR